jgi:hypothetical protein
VNIKPDLVCDTNILCEIIIQYFGDDFDREYPDFKEQKFINKDTAKILNEISREIESTRYIIASTFAFVELSRKFNKIFLNQITIDQFRSFIEQPPDWFLVADVDERLFEYLLDIPAFVTLNASIQNIEWADAIHIATALSRDHWIFSTSDYRIKALEIMNDKVL